MNALTSAAPSQAELAFDALERLLVTLALPPGEAVREKALAEAVGYGRTPVREAIQRLSSMGLLQVLPRKGLLVAPVNRAELQQVLEVRRVLERLLVVKACERAGHAHRQSLQDIAARMRMLGAAGDTTAFYRLDRQLDTVLADACGNSHLIAALAPLQVHCRRLWYLHRAQLVLTEAADLHAGLATAVAGGDSAGAVRAVNGIIAQLETWLLGLDHLR